jgi:uncharacterized protein YndB with AHSA1/START domain
MVQGVGRGGGPHQPRRTFLMSRLRAAPEPSRPPRPVAPNHLENPMRTTSLHVPSVCRTVSIVLLGLLAAGAQAAERAIDKQIEVKAGIQAVWTAWTTRVGITSFFAPDAVIDPRPGGAFHIHIDPLAAPGSRGADDMRYLALQAPTMLSFDWNAPPSLPQARQQRTVVILRLTAIDEQNTRVSLHHVGWGDGGEWDKAYTYFDRAWGNVLGSLKRSFEQGPTDWKPWMAQLAQMHAQAAAAPASAAASSAPR